MKTLTFKFEQITSKVNKQTSEEIVTTCSFSANGNFSINAKADNLERTKLFCSKLFNLLDTLKQGNKQMSVNGQKFNFGKEFNLYAVIDGKDFSLDYGDLITFDKIGFKCSAPTLRTDKQGNEQMNAKSRKIFTLQVWQLLQGAECKTQLMGKSATKQIDANVTAQAQYLLS